MSSKSTRRPLCADWLNRSCPGSASGSHDCTVQVVTCLATLTQAVIVRGTTAQFVPQLMASAPNKALRRTAALRSRRSTPVPLGGIGSWRQLQRLVAIDRHAALTVPHADAVERIATLLAR